MNNIFRTDASIDIGTGHVMRCLTLAQALREQGSNCRFICREHPGNLLGFIRQHNFEAICLSRVSPLGMELTGAFAKLCRSKDTLSVMSIAARGVSDAESS